MIITFVLCAEDVSDNTNEDSEFNHNSTAEDTNFDNHIPINIGDPKEISLIGFSNYKTEQKGNKYYVSIIFWFKRLSGERDYGDMTVTLIINNGKRLRSLEEKTATCVPLSEGTDIIPYDCSVDSDTPVSGLEAKPESITFEKLNSEGIKVSPLAEEQMENLEQQTKNIEVEKLKDLHFATLYDAKLTKNENNFTLEGSIDDIYFKDFPSDDLYLLLPKKDSDEKINATCSFTKDNSGKEGTLVCKYPKGSVSESLHGKVATDTTGDNLLTIAMEKGSEEKKLDYDGDINYSGYRHSNGGMSGGAIAAIVIAGAIALVAAVITAVVCRAPPKPPLQEESTLGVHQNNVIV